MSVENDYFKKHDIVPTISFKDGKTHIVQIAKRKIDTITTDSGPKEGITYFVIENKEAKRFFTTSIGLISKLAEIKENETIAIQMKSRKTEQGYQSYYDVQTVKDGFPVGEGEEILPEGEIPIPIIEEESGAEEEINPEKIPY